MNGHRKMHPLSNPPHIVINPAYVVSYLQFKKQFFKIPLSTSVAVASCPNK